MGRLGRNPGLKIAPQAGLGQPRTEQRPPSYLILDSHGHFYYYYLPDTFTITHDLRIWSEDLLKVLKVMRPHFQTLYIVMSSPSND